MDALERLGDRSAHAHEVRALRRPVARAPRAVLLAREHDERHALLLIAHRRVVDRHLLARREVPRPPAFLLGELVAEADVREGPADEHLVVPAARAVLVEVDRLHPLRDQVLAGWARRWDRSRTLDVVGRDRVA